MVRTAKGAHIRALRERWGGLCSVRPATGWDGGRAAAGLCVGSALCHVGRTATVSFCAKFTQLIITERQDV